MIEVWKPVVGYEGLYEVSNHGEVRSLDRQVRCNTGIMNRKGRVLKKQVSHDGYFAVHLCKKGGEERQRINRLVLTAFVSLPPFEGCVSNHKDSDRQNNCVYNLEWCSVTENNRHAIASGNSKPWLNSPFKKGGIPWNKGKALVSVLPSND